MSRYDPKSQGQKHLHFVDRINQDGSNTTIDPVLQEDHSVSTGPSNSGLDLIVVNQKGKVGAK